MAKLDPLTVFFALLFAITWGLGLAFMLIPARLIAVFGPPSIGNPLFLLAVYSPSLSAVTVMGISHGRAGMAVSPRLDGFNGWRTFR